MPLALMPPCEDTSHFAIAKLIQSFRFYKFLFGILANFGKKRVLFHFSFGFLGFFS